MTPTDILSQLQSGSTDAMTQVYAQYGRMVYNVCLRVLGDPHDAEDATQAVFILLLKKAHTLNDSAHLGGWLMRSAELMAREGRRGAMRRQRREKEAAAMHDQLDNPSGAAADADWRAIRPQLDAALAALPDKYRTPLVRVYLAGEEQRAVAQSLGLNEGTLRWRLSHALEKLRARLGGRLGAVMLLGLLGARACEAAPPDHLLPSLQAATRKFSAGAEDVAADTDVNAYVEGAMNAMFRQRLRYFASAAAILVVLIGVPLARLNFAANSEQAAARTQTPSEPTALNAASRTLDQASAPAPGGALDGQPVRAIDVQGNQRVKKESILRLLQTKLDQPFEQRGWDAERERLLETGQFESVVVGPPVVDDGGVKLSLQVTEKASPVSEFSSGPPEMILDQTALPEGGRFVLYSRNRFGNYPLAGFALHLGLRGDDRRVGNNVNLLFGNAYRDNTFKGREVDYVPGVLGAGSAGMNAGAASDMLQVNCCGPNRNRIMDLGAVDFSSVRVPKEIFKAQDNAAVVEGHVYVVRAHDKSVTALSTPLYFKLLILQHRDNNAVQIEWEPIKPGADLPKDTDF